jgi:biopolymer transport protein ExbB
MTRFISMLAVFIAVSIASAPVWSQTIPALEAQAEQLENRYDANEQELNSLRNQRKAALAELNDVFSTLSQISGEVQAGFENSVISAQIPNRSESLNDLVVKLNQSNDLPTANDFSQFWSTLMSELQKQGTVETFSAPVATSAGARETKDVTRVGTFNLVSNGKFLTYGKGGVAELPRQPGGGAGSSASSLQGASAGQSVEFALDPTQGTLLAATVESPSLMERVHQGGIVGYCIIALGIIALLVAVWRIFVLIGVAGAVNKQAKNLGAISAKNPLGRVLKVFEESRKSDTEALELKLSEAIMRETPKLNSWLTFVKVVSVVAPLMGLFGTVTGMIQTFQAITLFGAGDPKLMAGGISTALVTTVLGLVVAIPTVLLHTAAASRAKRVEEILEEQSAGMVARQIEKG